MANYSSSELTVTPDHSPSASDARSNSGSTSRSMSTESSDAQLSDSDDSQRGLPGRVSSAKQGDYSSSVSKSASLRAPNDSLNAGKNSISSIPVFALSGSPPSDSAISPVKPSTRPALSPPIQQPSRSNLLLKPAPTAAVSSSSAALSSFALDSAYRVAQAQSDSKSLFPAIADRRKSSVSSLRVPEAVRDTSGVSHAADQDITRQPTSVAATLATPERPPSPALSVSSTRSSRVIRASTANLAMNLAGLPRSSTRGADEPGELPALSYQRPVTQAPAALVKAVPPIRDGSLAPVNRSRSSSRPYALTAHVPSSPLISHQDAPPPLFPSVLASPRDLPPPPFPTDLMTPRDLPPPFPTNLLTPRDMPPPLPRAAPKHQSSDGRTAVGAVNGDFPPTLSPRQSPPPYPEALQQKRRSKSQHHVPASVLEMDEPPLLPPSAGNARNR